MPSRVLSTKWLLYYCVISMILIRISKFCHLGRSCPRSREEHGPFDSLEALGSEVRTCTWAPWERTAFPSTHICTPEGATRWKRRSNGSAMSARMCMTPA